MLLTEYKRYMKSKWNIVVLCFAWIPVLLSYFSTYRSSLELSKMIQEKPADLDLASVQLSYDGINGLTYLLNFFFSSDYYIIFTLILSIGFGAILGSEELRRRKNGFGNLIFTRINIKRGTLQIMTAQALYIVTVILLLFGGIFAVTAMVFPIKTDCFITSNLNLHTNSVLLCCSLLFAQMLILVLYEVLALLCTYVCSAVVENQYLISIVPVLIYLIPFVLCSLIGAVNHNFAVFLTYVVSEQFLLFINNIYAEHRQMAVSDFVLPAILIVFLICGWKLYIHKVERDYL